MRESLEQEVRTLRALFWSDRDPDGRVFAPLADAYRKAGEVKEALDLLSDGRSRHPHYATGHVVAARLFLEQAMEGDAERAARQALELDGENVLALSTLATVLETTGRDEEAGRLRATLLELDPEAEEELAARQESHATRGRPAPLVVPEPPLERTESAGWDTLEPVDLSEPATDPLAELRGAETMKLDFSGELDFDHEADHTDLPETALHLSPIPAEHDPFESVAPVSEEPAFAPEAAEMLTDLSALAPEPESSDDFEPVMELASLEPDPEPISFDEPTFDDRLGVDEADVLAEMSLDAPSTQDRFEPVLELDDLAPSPAAGEVFELSALAPQAPELDDVMELSALAPDEPAEDVMELSALAPDEPAEDVMELSALAPDEPAEDVMELSALAPDEPAEDVMELSALAPDEPAEDVMDLSALAPDEPAEDVMELSALAPDEPVGGILELDELAPDPALPPATSPSEPVWTRTLAELYVKQGFVDKAIEVLEHLRDQNPSAADIPARIAELRGGGGGAPGTASPRPSTHPSAMPVVEGFVEDDDEEMETLARELADGGGEHDHDTPFTWTERETEPDPEDDGVPIGDYFDRLLDWRPRDQS